MEATRRPSVPRAFGLVVLMLGWAACGFDASGFATSAPDAAAPDPTCALGESRCAGNVLRTCGLDGEPDPLLDVPCAFLCEAASCVDLSNLPAAATESCGPDAPALVPPAGAEVRLETVGDTLVLRCAPDCGGGTATITAVARVDQETAGSLSWFCLSTQVLPSDVTLSVAPGTTAADAVAVLVDGDVFIAGQIVLDGAAGSALLAGVGGPGGGSGGGLATHVGAPGGGACPGAGGGLGGVSINYGAGGGGGGGFALSGGAGGAGRSPMDDATGLGGAAGSACGNARLVPLIGGSGGGSGADGTCGGDCGWPGGGGGGTLQISSRTSIDLSGTISARGGAGYGVFGAPGGGGGGGGGGSGGAILLEAPALHVSGRIIVDGGDGGASNAGPGGRGATGTLDGGQVGASFVVAGQGGGGGGGDGGRVRLRSRDVPCDDVVSPVKACAPSPAPVVP